MSTYYIKQGHKYMPIGESYPDMMHNGIYLTIVQPGSTYNLRVAPLSVPQNKAYYDLVDMAADVACTELLSKWMLEFADMQEQRAYSIHDKATFLATRIREYIKGSKAAAKEEQDEH